MNRSIRLLSAVLLCSVLAACATQGKPGTPLPPQNKAVGEKWPPEVREFIDTVQVMFVRGKPTPSDEEIERALKLKFNEDREIRRSEDTLVAKYISGWPLNDRGESSYRKRKPNFMGQHVQLELQVDINKYCINPYDFAVYTGTRFKPDGEPNLSPFDLEVPLNPIPSDEQGRPYGYDYVWGMFQRSPVHSYHGTNSVWIAITEDDRCIHRFEINTFFQAVQPVSNKG